MLFHSLQFAVFFLIVHSLYMVLPHKWQNRMLLAGSYYFYGSWDWRFLSLIFASTICDYFCGLGIQNSASQQDKKKFVAVSIIFNLSLLGVFKYYDFFAVNFQTLMANAGFTIQPYILGLALPIGISFYTFQTISYTVDVYRRKLKAEPNFFNFALYVSFFPQLIAGPIERGVRLLPQIQKPRTITSKDIYHGIYFFFWGLFLKIFIGDNLAKMVDPVYNSPGPYEGASVLLATYAFSFQIYCDFAGYSFMAIGLAKTMGVEIMENFRRPYFSKNISDFWRRWHISLSTWFRDYFFLPLYIYVGNSRVLKKLSMKTRHGIVFLFTLLVTEYLLGLWHGAGWNFGIFGIYHAVMIGMYYYTCRFWDKMNRFVQIFLTYQVVALGWLIFRATSVEQISQMVSSIFLNFSIRPEMNLPEKILEFLSLIFILVVIQVAQERKNDTWIVLKWPRLAQAGFFSLMAVLIFAFGDFGAQPFIYFQF